MDKEIIELLKTLAGSTETLVIWYMVMDFAKVLFGWCSGVAIAYLFFSSIKEMSNKEEKEKQEEKQRRGY